MSGLGSNRIKRFTPAARRASAEARQARADARAAELAPVIAELQSAGVMTLEGIAAALDERGIPTPSGHRHWHAMQVARLLKRLPG
jgi:hypothetical protein